MSRANPRGFTLVEMLVAMAITLVMMGAVVTLFANVSNSVRNRRAVVEMSGQLRHVRNMLQQDVAGATCPGLPWQRPEENQGYIEIIEGPWREGLASSLIDADPDAGPELNWPPTAVNPEIDHATSILPASNLPFNSGVNKARWATDGAGLGDADDILMLTVRNEHEPFVGRVPESDSASKTSTIRPNDSEAVPFGGGWKSETIRSPLAEVVWYAVENPGFTHDPDDPSDDPTNDLVDPSADGFFGEPGMRTIYRRTLLIAPWINPYRFVAPDGSFDDTFEIDGDNGDQFTAKPGLVRILSDDVDADEVDEALAALIAFQEAYDLSVRLEFDPLLGVDGRWKIVANTLADLTKRENRYEHHFYRRVGNGGSRAFPYAVTSLGSGYSPATDPVEFVQDQDVSRPSGATDAAATAHVDSNSGDAAVAYTIEPENLDDNLNRRYTVRPFAFVDQGSATAATARAMLNDEGEVVRVVHGLVPLARERRGEDVMLTDVLGFDLRVYDPGAPLFVHAASDTVLEPTDPAWTTAYLHEDNMDADPPTPPAGAVGLAQASGASDVEFPYVGQGAYVDLGYGFDARRLAQRPPRSPDLPPPVFASQFEPATTPWFFAPRALGDVYGSKMAPGYAVYDTWSFHYENNGVNEDGDEIENGVWQLNDGDGVGTPQLDEATNGLDDPGVYFNASGVMLTPAPRLLGPDDVGERETVPPYDRPLRALQVVLRLYERDSRQIRQVRVNQSFVPE